MLFAVMAVIQVPAMAVACATQSQPVTLPTTSADHHHQHSGHHQHQQEDVAADLSADAIHDASVCQAMSCCMAPNQAIRSPVAIDLLIGLIGQAPAPVMLPALQEPADPPPRLQV
jgi:hypothetical protein